VKVAIGNNGIATQDNADFQYIDKWSSIYTWGGKTVPGEGDIVVIEKVCLLLTTALFAYVYI